MTTGSRFASRGDSLVEDEVLCPPSLGYTIGECKSGIDEEGPHSQLKNRPC
jgi:hypothetical protein